MPELLRALPASLTAFSWNANHFWTADQITRRHKLNFLQRQILFHKPDVVFLQEAGYLRGAAAEVWRRHGYVLYRQQGRRTRRGERPGQDSAIIVRLTFQRRYGLAPVTGDYGCYHGLKSSRQLSFSRPSASYVRSIHRDGLVEGCRASRKALFSLWSCRSIFGSEMSFHLWF